MNKIHVFKGAQPHAHGQVTIVSVWLLLLALTLAVYAEEEPPGPPVITSFSPASGPEGTRVTVEGQDLEKLTRVFFGGVEADFTVFDDHQFTTTVPTGATNAPISVLTPFGTAFSAVAFTVTAAEAPVLTGFSPTSGPAGTQVTINGAHLSGTTSVTFNGVPAEFQEGFSGSSLLATVPSGASSGPIRVVTPQGTVATTAPFTVTTTPPPQIDDFSPLSGPVGTAVLINGRNVADTTAVRFNGVAAEFTLFGNTISAKVPPGATTGPITVVTPAGLVTSGSAFVVNAPDGQPMITDFTPTEGRPGDLVTINGQNLVSATSVTFNGAPADFDAFGFSVIATVPANATSGPITVVTPKGTANSAGRFTLVSAQAPQITGFTPQVGSPNTVVTITGTNLNRVTEVRFGGAAAKFTVLSGSDIVAQVPSGATTGAIVVSGSTGTTRSESLFYVPAEILGFNPQHGPAGTTLTIAGMNFTDALAVQIGGVNASYTYISAGELRATVPEEATTGIISVATPAGFAYSDDNFYLPPRIDRFEPASGLALSPVTITGANLLGATSVSFAGREATFAAPSLTALVANVPASAGDGAITVVTPGGTATSAESFFVGLYGDVAAGLAAMPDAVDPGGFIGYTITVTNRGPLEAGNVILTDRLPAGSELLFPPSGADCSESNGLITCNLGALPPGGDMTIRLSVVTRVGQYFTNEVRVASTTSDPDPGNNMAVAITRVNGAPPLEEAKLRAAMAGGALELSWPASASGFILETTPTLSAPTWSAVATAPVLLNGAYRVSQSAGSGKAYYRLRKP